MSKERTNGASDGNNQLGFGVIEILPFPNVARAIRSVAPEFMNGLVERRG